MQSSEHCRSEAPSPAVGQSSDTPQGSIGEPILFNTSISKLQGGTECPFSKFTDSAKSEAVDTSEGWAAIKRNLDRLRKEQKTWNATKRKCKVLFLWRNTRSQYRLGAKSQGSSFAKWDLTVLAEKLTVSQQRALTSKMAQSNLASPGGQNWCFFPSAQYQWQTAGGLTPVASSQVKAQWRKFSEGQQRWLRDKIIFFYEKLTEIKALSMVKRCLRDGKHKRETGVSGDQSVTGHKQIQEIAVKHQESLSYCHIGQTLEKCHQGGLRSLHSCINSKYDLIQPCSPFQTQLFCESLKNEHVWF